MHAMPLIIGVLACLAIAYRFYSAFLAAKVAALDDKRPTPAHTMNDGQNYYPTNKWVLFGHHFAAISGAGPLIGPVLAIQFGYMPGLIWLVVGVCLAGAAQDMLVLAASVRHQGRSLAQISSEAIGPVAGGAASIAILFIVVLALSVLGVVVVKALGGEEIKLPPQTELIPGSSELEYVTRDGATHFTFPPETIVRYPSGAEVTRGEQFTLAVLGDANPQNLIAASQIDNRFPLPDGAVEEIPGSSWGTFTIACTIPIALFVGLYMYKIRKGRTVEASLIGAALVLAATVAGNWIPGSALEPYFSLTRETTIAAICAYGFIASVLPVWLLLCPRDYLSSFLKIGTVALLVVGVVVANPKLEAPAVNEFFAGGGGPYFNGAIFPFVFICIMCGAISGFHALVSSGTTPKMIGKESDIRPIGYGAMLIEGLVGVVALIAAASLPQGDYWAINIDLARIDQFAHFLEASGANTDNLAEIERQVGGESLRGRTGGAVTLAVGMSSVLTEAADRVSFGKLNVDSMIKYWYHFAIMFEALFILTTIDTGTRIARFLLQETLGKVHKKFDKMDWLPGAVLCTALITAGWGGLIWTGSIDTIWPMFGIANQLLAVLALCVVTTVLINGGRVRYAWATILPMLFVIATTVTAAKSMIGGRFWDLLQTGLKNEDWPKIMQGGLNIGVTVLLLLCLTVIVASAIVRWIFVLWGDGAGKLTPTSGTKTP